MLVSLEMRPPSGGRQARGAAQATKQAVWLQCSCCRGCLAAAAAAVGMPATVRSGLQGARPGGQLHITGRQHDLLWIAL